MKRPTPKCLICGKPAHPADRTADGQYAHIDCLRANQTR